MEILPSCNRVSTVVLLHHLDFKETFGEKDRWELHCFEQILGVVLYKTIRPLASYLTYYPS